MINRPVNQGIIWVTSPCWQQFQARACPKLGPRRPQQCRHHGWGRAVSSGPTTPPCHGSGPVLGCVATSTAR